MEVQVAVLRTFHPPLLSFSKPRMVCLSPCADRIIVISEDSRLVMYFVHDSAVVSAPALGNFKYQSARFSTSGDEVALVTESFSTFILKWRGRDATKIAEQDIKHVATQLPNMTNQVTENVALECLLLDKTIVVLLWNQELLLGLRWIIGEKWNVYYATKVEQIKDIKVDKEMAYVLTDIGFLKIYNIKSGCKINSVNLRAIISQDKTLLYFTKIAVSDKHFTVIDWNDNIYVFTLDDLKIVEKRSASSVLKENRQLSSSTSEIPTKRTLFSASHISESVPTPARAYSYRHFQKAGFLGFSGDSNIEELDFSLEMEYAMVTALDGFKIIAMNLLDCGLTVWYEGGESRVLYRIYSIATGACVAEKCLEAYATPILGGFLDSVDAVISPLCLQLFLYNVSKECLATKLLQKAGTEPINQTLKGPVWQDVNVALKVLSEGIRVRQLEIIRFALENHREGFKLCIGNIEYHNDVDVICENLKNLQDLLLSGIEDNLHNMQLAENLVVIFLNYNYDLLSSLYETTSSVSRDLLEIVEQIIMKFVLSLRSYLYHTPKPVQEEQANSGNSFPIELSGMSSSTKEMWQLWANLPDEEIIYQAVDHSFIPLAQTFFVSNKGKTLNEAANYINATIDNWILRLLRDYQISQCQKIFKNLCRNSMTEMKTIYLNTSEEKIQSFVFGFLSKCDILSEEEINAGLFIKDFRQILRKSEIGQMHKILLTDDKPPITVNSVLEQSSTWRDLVWAELAFSLDDIELQYLVQPSAAWSYLLLVNRPDLLQIWIQMQCNKDYTLSTEKFSSEQTQIHDFSTLFQQWEITQEMIDAVYNCDCTKFTKDVVLDHLSRYGKFSTSEKLSLNLILTRFLRTDNLSNIHFILDLSTSNLTNQEYCALLLKFCVQYRLSHVLFSSLVHVDNLFELVRSVDVSENANAWLQAWLHMVQLVDNPESHLLKTAESSLYYLIEENTSSYLKERPLLIMILIILSSQSPSALLSGKETLKLISPELLDSLKKSMPVLEQVLTQEAWSARNKPDITMYELLEKTIKFDVSKLFGWQETHRKKSDDGVSKLPSFVAGNEFEKYAYHESINYEYYLRQGRPTYAVCKFVLEQFKVYKNMSKKRTKEACNIAHALALCNFANTRIAAACVSFMEMLSVSAEKARLHITVGNLILSKDGEKESDIASLLQSLMNNRESAAVHILSLLEAALVPTDIVSQTTNLRAFQQWVVAVKFARVHNLPLPASLLVAYCKEDMWLHFVLCLELYQYPLEQTLHLTENFKSKSIQEHLSHALSRSLDKNQTPMTRPKKEARLRLRDSRKLLYSKIGLKSEDKSNDSSSEASMAEYLPGMVASSWSSDSSTALPAMMKSITSSFLSLGTENQLFSLLISCHNNLDPPQALLNASLTYSCPLLAVLATCYESCSILPCICNWLLVSILPALRDDVQSEFSSCINEHSWTADQVQRLFVQIVNHNYISTLATAFQVFYPDSPLRDLTEAIKSCAVDKCFDVSADNIYNFKAKAQKLLITVLSQEDASFFCDRQWVYTTAVQLVCTTLAKSFTSTFYQYRFLQLLCQTNFCEYITVEAPDFAHLQQLQECLLETGVQLDYSALCLERRHSERELQACLDHLVASQNFTQAIKYATIAGLSRDAVVKAQWNNAIERLQEEANKEFWKNCQSDFENANIHPLVAAEFFHQHADTRQSRTEKYLVLRLAHYWYSLAKRQSVRKSDCYLTKAIEVELDMWKSRLQLHVTDELQPEVTETPKLFTKTKAEVLNEAGVGYLKLETKLEDSEQTKALDSVIGELLDQGDVSIAVRLERLFCYKNKDVQILLTCMSLAEGEIQAYQLSLEQRSMIESTLTTPSGFRRRPLYFLRSPSFSTLPPSPQTPQNLVATIDHQDICIATKDQQTTLTTLEKMLERLKHGKSIGARISACYRVAINTGRSFVDIITTEDTLGLLKSAIVQDCMNKFAVASDLSSVNQISKETMIEFLCEEIVAAVSRGFMQGEAACEFPPVGGIMWGCQLDSCFPLVLEICPDTSELGNQLVTVISKLHSSQPEAAKQVYTVVVELLIRAHDCFTAACNMEGIAQVLQKAKSLTANLLQQEHWQLMVRMVTGIGRYTEMSYIFQILKEHQRFEFLLSKGMDKVPELQLALLEFVSSHCAEDRELLRMVALHFRLYSQVAQIWEHDARATINRLLNIANQELGTKPIPLLTKSFPFTMKSYVPQNTKSITPSRGSKPLKPADPNILSPHVLTISPDVINLLKMAMQNYALAAEYYLQADKLMQAMQSSQQAELVAVQMSLTNGVPMGQTVECLLEQPPTRVTELINRSLSFPQAVICARAYGHLVNWEVALFEHCILMKDQQYLTDFMKSMTLTPAMVEDVARRFWKDSSTKSTPITQDMAQIMKQMVNSVQCVEIKYRLASELGFKDILEKMLTGSDLPYLKDTVWRSGSKRRY